MTQLLAAPRTEAPPKLDGRTKRARFLRDMRAELLAHVGAKPSAPQKILVDRIANTALRLAELDNHAASVGLNARQHRDYTNLNATFRRMLADFGISPAAVKPPDLNDYLNARGAA